MAEKKHAGGRPTAFREEYSEQAYKYCLLGATDAQLAEFFEVSEQTINAWKEKYPEFLESLKKGKHVADANVAHALYHRALGFTWIEQQAIKLKTVSYKDGHKEEEERIEIVELEKTVPPDTAAAFIWLKNRAGWKDKQEIVGNMTYSVEKPSDDEFSAED